MSISAGSLGAPGPAAPAMASVVMSSMMRWLALHHLVAQRLGEQLVLELAGHGAQRCRVERLLAAQVDEEARAVAIEQHVGAVEEHVRGGVEHVARVEADVERQGHASTSAVSRVSICEWGSNWFRLAY